MLKIVENFIFYIKIKITKTNKKFQKIPENTRKFQKTLYFYIKSESARKWLYGYTAILLYGYTAIQLQKKREKMRKKREKTRKNLKILY